MQKRLETKNTKNVPMLIKNRTSPSLFYIRYHHSVQLICLVVQLLVLLGLSRLLPSGQPRSQIVIRISTDLQLSRDGRLGQLDQATIATGLVELVVEGFQKVLPALTG